MEEKNQELINEVGLNVTTNEVEEVESNPQEEIKELLDEISEPEQEEERELTEEEKKELYIEALKASKIKFHPSKNPTVNVGTETVTNFLGKERKVKIKAVATNITETKFGKSYKEKRRKKNAQSKKSRRANR